ncbi:MAG: hypothetical protein EOP00_18795, partial [Pedobacter sp.]
MKKNFLTIFIAFISFASFAQQTKADSILNLLNKHPQKDTLRVNLLNSYFMQKLRENPDSTMVKKVEEALRISENLNYQKGIALSFQKLGIAFQYFLGNPKMATNY